MLAAEVQVIAVHPDLQGQGLGRKLLSAVEATLQAAGVQLCVVRLPLSSSGSAQTTAGLQPVAEPQQLGAVQIQAAQQGLWQGYAGAESIGANTAAGLQGLLHQRGGSLHVKQLV